MESGMQNNMPKKSSKSEQKLGSYFNQVFTTPLDGPQVDAFGSLRTSEPRNLFSTQCQYDADPLQMEGGATGTGVAPAHNADTRMVKLSATAGTGVSFFQSYQYHPYVPGKSQKISITGVLDTAVADAVVDVGYGDASNGIFYRQNGTSGLEFVRRSKTSGSVVEEVVTQANWNLDKFDGSGKSGITLDASKCFILIIDLQFLGMGRVRVGFVVGGKVILAHEFNHANILAVPYIQTATLPISMVLTATATGSTKNCYFKCAAVDSEGGSQEYISYPFATPEGTVTAASGARTHILSLRPLTTFNSITNRKEIVLKMINILVTGSNPIFWELVLGATFSAGPTWANVNGTYSGAEYATAGTLSGVGLVIDSGYVAATASTKSSVYLETTQRYPITLDRAGATRANGTLSLIVTGIGGTSATRATMEFETFR